MRSVWDHLEIISFIAVLYCCQFATRLCEQIYGCLKLLVKQLFSCFCFCWIEKTILFWFMTFDLKFCFHRVLHVFVFCLEKILKAIFSLNRWNPVILFFSKLRGCYGGGFCNVVEIHHQAISFCYLDFNDRYIQLAIQSEMTEILLILIMRQTTNLQSKFF